MNDDATIDFPHCNVQVTFKNGAVLTMHIYYASGPLELMITTLQKSEENAQKVAEVFWER